MKSEEILDSTDTEKPTSNDSRKRKSAFLQKSDSGNTGELGNYTIWQRTGQNMNFAGEHLLMFSLMGERKNDGHVHN